SRACRRSLSALFIRAFALLARVAVALRSSTSFIVLPGSHWMRHTMSRWFWKALRREATPHLKSATAKRRGKFRPMVEQLESLTLPSGTQMVPTLLLSDTHQTGPSGRSGISPLDGPGATALSPTQIRNAYGINNIVFP